MRILSFNAQRGYQPGLKAFLRNTLESGRYDFLLLQEVNEIVLPFLEHPGYRFIRSMNRETGKESELCILYRADFKKIHAYFQSFSSMRYDPVEGFKHPSFGFMWATFQTGDSFVQVGSVHLHSGIHSGTRHVQTKLVKQLLLEDSDVPTILGGDFNAGYPGEPGRLAAILAPEFSWLTSKLGSTLDSRYSQNVAHLPNRIAALFAYFNLRIPLRADHFFTDLQTASYGGATRILPDRVSDHSPVELEIA